MTDHVTSDPAPTGAVRCPCGTGAEYAACCGRLHAGASAAVTAEELMRSRYSAFALGDEACLLRSWHPSTRPDHVRFVEDQRWTGLDVLGSRGGPFDQDGIVEFVASYERHGDPRELREVSRFARHEGRWVYVDAVAAST